MVRLLGSKQKDSIGSILFPTSGKRDELKRKGFKPKDHMKDNRLIIKGGSTPLSLIFIDLRIETQEKVKEKQREAAMEPPALFKMSQFKEVSSKVFEEKPRQVLLPNEDHDRIFLERRQSEKRLEDLAYLKRVQREEMELKLSEALQKEGKVATPRKAPVPRADDVAKLAPKREVSFIAKNRAKALTLAPPRKEEHKSPTKHESYGRVPEYLEQRNLKLALEKERARRNAPDPDCPPGMRLMPEDERRETLSKLLSSQQEVMQHLQNMPFVIETPSQKNRQHMLESKLKDIDNAIKIFDKPKVYIAI